MFFNVFFASLFFLFSFFVQAENVFEKEMGKSFFCENKKEIFLGVNDGDVTSLYNAGVMHYNGYCVEKNLNISYNLFAQAASKGHIKSYHTVALILHVGGRGEKDLAKADEIFAALLVNEFSATVRYACAIQSGKDDRLITLPKLNSLESYICN